MQEELNQFIANDVWELVPQPKNMTVIETKWVFRNKLDENGIVSRNKAILVAQGYNQQEGIDYDETYASVARLESIRILLAYACAIDFKLFQMDVKSAFLNSFINEEVVYYTTARRPISCLVSAFVPASKRLPKHSHLEAVKTYLPNTLSYYILRYYGYPKGIGIETVVYTDSDHAGVCLYGAERALAVILYIRGLLFDILVLDANKPLLAIVTLPMPIYVSVGKAF
ncbi:retrovirus-related pol polyprotein from transposon TNT 1-94 [Tanacetum coccineum]